MIKDAGELSDYLRYKRLVAKYALTEPEEKIINTLDVTGISALVKIYDKITNLNEKINDLISIDELNYFDILNDSSSSGFVISEEKLEIDMNPFDQNYSELECSELSFSEYNSDDDVDTPIFKESNELNQNDDNSNSIDDLFIKN